MTVMNEESTMVLEQSTTMVAEQTLRVETKEKGEEQKGKEMGAGDNTAAGDGAYVTEKKTMRFWAILMTLSITGILAALDGTIVVTTLPTITHTLGGGADYIWVSGVFFLAVVALQPLYGQLANIFGRRNLLFVTIGIFVLGSGICGGATSMNMLIAGRLVQGIGCAGINLLIELIICDLLPLRERGQYTAIMMSTALIGATLGPWIGGELIAKSTWHWVFYMNLPIGGAAMAMVLVLVKLNTRMVKARDGLRHIDFVGNVLFVTSTIAIMSGLIYGGVKFPWGSWHVLVPLILGIVGMAAFAFWEASPWCNEPALPKKLVSNRTSVSALFTSFLHMSLLQWITYFMSVYYQVAKHASAARAGIFLLANMFGFLVGSVTTGNLVTKTGRYRPYQMVGWAVAAIVVGTYTLLKHTTSVAAFEVQIFFSAVGFGIVMPCLLPALQAELHDNDSASAMAAMTIARSFGSVWGTLVPSIIFNNIFDKHAHLIKDKKIRDELTGGLAYAHATKDFVGSLHGDTKDQVIATYTEALKFVWYIAMMVCLLGFLGVFVQKELVLRTNLETDFGVKERKKDGDDAAESGDGQREKTSTE